MNWDFRGPSPETAIDLGNEVDRDARGIFEEREADWRSGAIVYQVLVDRFAPPTDLDAKRHLYPSPKRLRSWNETPTGGPYLPELMIDAHELDFWGGDLASLRSRLDYVQELGADVLYLNPIHEAFTNHHYDAVDYSRISPELGTRSDLVALAKDVHQRRLRLVLDGVFNHVGRRSPIFRAAKADAESPYRLWFALGSEYPGGVRAWNLAENLPELLLENPRVQEYIYAGPDSIVRSYLRDGVDGWRLDVAFDLGFAYLKEITAAAHEERPGSLILGEVANFPSEWFPSVDGIMQFTLRRILILAASGALDPAHAQRMLARVYRDASYEHMLRSWIHLDNHDTPRLADALPDEAARRLALVLQFTLPGSPNLYYGTELGMRGSGDPETRAPMRWDLAGPENRVLAMVRALIAIRRDHRALRAGGLRWLETDRLVGFERFTDRAQDMVLVLINPSEDPVEETVLVPDSKLMDRSQLVDLMGDSGVMVDCSLLHLSLPARSACILIPEVNPAGGYSPYKRVQ